MSLTGLSDVDVIVEDGSPAGRRFIAFWNPPLLYGNSTSTVSGRRSPITETAHLIEFFLNRGLRTIVFCKSRRLCEILLCFTRQQLAKHRSGLGDAICVYRGGYTAAQRREIEASLVQGSIQAVIATNALELGIDIGHLDAVVMLGYPGSVASFWQEVGRCGRRQNDSFAVMVAEDCPLDQFYVRDPANIMNREGEMVVLDWQNRSILGAHLACAAFEEPLQFERDQEYFGSGYSAFLPPVGLLRRGDAYHYIGSMRSGPSSEVPIRHMETEVIAVLDEVTGSVLEQLEFSRALFVAYEGAVYLHQGRSYVIRQLDRQRGRAIAQPRSVNYWTQQRDFKNIDALATEKMRPLNSLCSISYGPTRVTYQVFGYRKVIPETGKVLDVVELDLEPYVFESYGWWIDGLQLIAL